MTIQIRAAEAQARKAIKQVEADVRSLQAATVQANAAMRATGGGGAANLVKWGSQVQWAGRQLTYNFTLPLGVAGLAATKWAFDAEKAFVRVQKVYGDFTLSQQTMDNELQALDRNFEALSNRFGVHRAQVNDIAADWAAAGASGVALAKSVKLTMETMILGELDAATATESLIAIQAQYGESIEDLAKTIDVLNIVENQTGTTMGDLIQSMSRSAGAARTAGVDVRHLAAMTAALVPATGGAAQAGNGLRSIISRLLAPTREASEILGMMGLSMTDLNWVSLNATQRLERLAQEFQNLSDAQKVQVSASVASRWQINRFDVLMRDIINTNGYYQKALAASADETRNYQQRVRELNAVLNSNPAKMQQMWTTMQNASIRIIQPLIPWLLYLTSEVAELATKFSELNPVTQKWIVFGAAILALIGPIARYLGAVGVLFGILGKAITFSGGALGGFLVFMSRLVTVPFSAIATGFGAIIGGVGSMMSAAVAAPAKIAAGMGGATAAYDAGLKRMGAAAGWFSGMFSTVAQKIAGESVGISRNVNASTASFVSGWRGVPAAAMVASSGAASAFASGAPAFAAAGTASGVAYSSGLTTSSVSGIGAWFAAQMAYLASIPQIMGTAGAVAGRAWATGTALAIPGAELVAAGRAAAAAVDIGFVSIIPAAGATGVAAGRTLAIGAGTAVASSSGGILASMRGVLAKVVGMVATFLPSVVAVLSTVGRAIIAALTGPWGIAIGIVVTLLATFWDDIKKLFDSLVSGFRRNSDGIAAAFAPLVGFFNRAVQGIVRAFYALPQGVQNAMMAVVNIVKSAALAVYSLFSYLNPFAHHSPSLVETVTWGMAEIRKQYASVGNVGGIFRKAAADLHVFKTVAASMNFDEWSSKREDVGKMMPSNLGNFNVLVEDWKVLNKLAIAQKNEINAMQPVVDGWRKRLDDANAAIKVQESVLSDLKTSLDNVKSAYEAHEQAISNYARSGIVGMRAMSDAMFENEMAQKRLQLAIMDLEDAGQTVEDLKGKMASLQGSIEGLRGEANDLRAAGAGSDVLGPIEAQIDQMQAAYDAMGSATSTQPINELQAELERLQREGQRLDLENSLKFDPLTRQVQQLAEGLNELTFDQIIAGINSERAAMAALQPQIDQAQTAYDSQKAIVDSLTASRDALQASYDQESASLQALQDEYAITEQAIRDIESALNDMSSAARSSASGAGGGGGGSMSPGAENFAAGAGANWADVGGGGGLGRMGGIEDQSSLIDELTQQMQDELSKTLESLDMLGPIKEKWNQVVAWWNSNVTPGWNNLVGVFKDVWNGLDFSGFSDKFSGIGDTLSNAWGTFTGFIDRLRDLFGPQIENIWNNIVSAVGPAFNEVKQAIEPLWASIKDGLSDIGVFFEGLWSWIQPLLAIIGGTLLAVLSGAFRAIGNIIGPIINWLGDLFQAVIQIVQGVIQFVTGILQAVGGVFTLIVGLVTGNGEKIREGWNNIWNGLGQAVSGLWNVVAGVWQAIVDTISAAIEVVWGAVSGFAQGIWDFFVWLWNQVEGTVSDMWNSVVNWFTTKTESISSTVGGWVSNVGQFFSDMWTNVTGWVSNLWNSVVNYFTNLKNDTIARVTELVNNVVQWFKDLPGKALNALGTVNTFLQEKGTDLIHGLWEGAKNLWNTVSDWFGDVPSNVKNALGDLGSTLLEAGKNILKGFLDGLKKKWEDVKDFVGGIGDWIADHKGPKQYDLGLLVQNGEWVMQGFGAGLDDEFQSIKQQVQGMGPELARNFNMPDLPINDLSRQFQEATNSMALDATARSQSVIQHNETKNYYFYGDFVFPGISSGDDAEEFARNLGDLAGGK